MRKEYHIYLLLLLGSFMLFPSETMGQADRLVAFPGAEGFGRYTSGGRGGDVYHVTNLADSGEGSLRYGIQSANGPRTIVFDVSGTIMLNGSLKIDKPNITIAGQTAPGDGITLGGDDLNVKAGNIIVRYIRVRLGDQSGNDDDAVSINAGSNIIFDHVRASWSIDETLSCQSETVDSLTVQWCMVTESLHNSHHEKGPHGYGGIVGGLRQTFHHNLYAHHNSRSPKVTWRRHCKVDFRNNVIYNWGTNNCYDGSSGHMNWVNNYYKAGPGTKSTIRDRIFELFDKDEGADYLTHETSLYAAGNYVDGYPAVTADNWNGGIDFSDGASEKDHRAETPFDYPSITEQSAEVAYPLVLESAGASIKRDLLDKRIINEVETGTATYGNNGIIDSQNDVGGWPELKTLPPPTDTDRDGMPDEWETEKGLNPNNPEDRNDDRNTDGFTNLEEYLHEVISLNSVSSKHRTSEEKMALQCYPNPAHNSVYIDLPFTGGHSTIRILNMAGQCIYTETSSEEAIQVDLGTLNRGIYHVVVIDEIGTRYSQNLVLQ